jgi:hypothetical protein
MDYHGITMKGPFWVENQNINSFSSEDEGKLRYPGGADMHLYYGSSTRWTKLNKDGYGEIPQNAKILVYKDTAITGYTLIGSVDDELIYITKGSANGGEVGGSLKIGSTWTQPNHLHPEPIHIHSIGSHSHSFSGTTSIALSSLRNDKSGKPLTEWQNHSHSISFSTDISIGNTADNVAQNTGNSAPANSWRPLGMNYTIQNRT